MGWFDDDDDSEEEEEPQTMAAAENDEHEQDDPLDAYMKSLDAAANNDAATTTTSTARTGRLDMDNEDEATSHWHGGTTESTIATKNHRRQDDDEEEGNAAQQALDSMFHRAGSNNRKDKKEDNFKLAPVHHEEMTYPDFEKSFYTPSDTSRGHEWRQEHEITCLPGTIDRILSFHECRSTLGDDLYDKIHLKAGFTTPTLVQSQTLPVALSGHDALVTASTGSGKTLAYTWPMIVHLQHQAPLQQDETGPMAVVLVPTRELAIQVHKQVKSMMPSHLMSLAITGGISNYHLLKDLKQSTGCHAVVATPGRFLDLLGKKKRGLSLSRVTFIVLDECDRMLSMGFEQQVTSILQNVRRDRQSLMLSATMGQKVERVARQWLHNPIRIAIGRTGKSSEHVQQHVMVLPSYEKKRAWLLEMLPVLSQVGRTLVFVATRNECEELAQVMRQNHSMRIETLHGEKHQSDRNAALRAFSRGELDALIATDVASRGLDVKNVSTVVNFDPAKNLDAHVHRIGRAGRLSKDDKHNKGVAYTLLTSKNADFALVLANAFEREGRKVTKELMALANTSRRSGNVAAKRDKSGLGYNVNDESSKSGNGYYGPSTSAAAAGPPAKRSRWG